MFTEINYVKNFIKNHFLKYPYINTMEWLVKIKIKNSMYCLYVTEKLNDLRVLTFFGLFVPKENKQLFKLQNIFKKLLVIIIVKRVTI